MKCIGSIIYDVNAYFSLLYSHKLRLVEIIKYNQIIVNSSSNKYYLYV